MPLRKGGVGQQRHKFTFTLRHPRAERFEIQACFPNLGKEFAFFFLDVMRDLLAQHRHFGIVKRHSGLHRFDLGDQNLGASMLNRRFVEKIGFLRGFSCRRVEELFFDLGMNPQCVADIDRKGLLILARFCGLIRVEIPLDLAMVCFQKRNCVGGYGIGRARARFRLECLVFDAMKFAPGSPWQTLRSPAPFRGLTRQTWSIFRQRVCRTSPPGFRRQ